MPSSAALIESIDALDPLEELREGPIGEEGVALHREIGRVDLQQEPVLDDDAIFVTQRLGDGVQVLVARGVVPVLHRGHDDARGRGGHERLRERRAGDERALRFDFGRVAVGDVRDGRRRRHEVHLHPCEARHGQFDVVGMVDEVPHDADGRSARRTRSCGAARR